jgi:hypothetical protein
MKFFSQFTDCPQKIKAIDTFSPECGRYEPNLTVTVDFLTKKTKTIFMPILTRKYLDFNPKIGNFFRIWIN